MDGIVQSNPDRNDDDVVEDEAKVAGA